MFVRPLHPPNAEFPILVTLVGIVTFVRLVQFAKAPLPMLVTTSGISMLVRPLPLNALSLIIVRLAGIWMFAREVQP